MGKVTRLCTEYGTVYEGTGGCHKCGGTNELRNGRSKGSQGRFGMVVAEPKVILRPCADVAKPAFPTSSKCHWSAEKEREITGLPMEANDTCCFEHVLDNHLPNIACKNVQTRVTKIWSVVWEYNVHCRLDFNLSSTDIPQPDLVKVALIG